MAIGQRILAILGLVLIAVTFTPLDRWWATKLAGSWNDPKGEVLIVLGGSLSDDGIIGESSYLRAVYAWLAWREGSFKNIVLCGGGPGKNSVAEAMRLFLVSQQIPPDIIRMESRSRSTRENAIWAKTILDGIPGSKVLLTSDYHMYRAEHTFRQAGIPVLPRPVPDVTKRAGYWFLRWDAFLDLVTETTKIGYYYFRGWI